MAAHRIDRRSNFDPPFLGRSWISDRGCVESGRLQRGKSEMSEFVASSSIENHYLANRLSYSRSRESGEEEFGAITLRTFLKAWFVWWLASYGLLFLSLLVLGPILFIAGVDFAASGSLFTLLWLGAVIAAAFIPQRRWISAWDHLVDGRAVSVDTSYAMVAQSLLDRGTPASVKPVRMRNPHLRAPNNYLHVEIPQYEIWVSVFPYGEDLFLGWTMNRRNRTGGIFFRYLWERILVVTGKSTDFHFQIAANEARALRDAVHNSTREGVELAISGVRGPTIAEAFGYKVPIERESTRGGSSSTSQGMMRPQPQPPSSPPIPSVGMRPPVMRRP